MVHPDVTEPGKTEPALKETVYPLTEGLTSRRVRELVSASLERAPVLPEWIEPSVLAREAWRDWRTSLCDRSAEPADGAARKRLAYDEIFANQLALGLLAPGQPPTSRTYPCAATAA